MHTNTERTDLSHKYIWHIIELEEKEAGLKSYLVHSTFQSRVSSIISLTSVHLASA